MVRPISMHDKPEDLVLQKTVSLPRSLWVILEKLKKVFHEPNRSAILRRIIVEWLKDKGLMNSLG